MMRRTALIMIVALAATVADAMSAACPECGLSQAHLVTYWGYPVQEHIIRTSDGYLLNILRIPHGRHPSSAKKTRPPVLMRHGLVDSAFGWLSNLPSHSMGFVLADNGFDVWMANDRGNKQSPTHCSVDTCWDFSFHEMGVIDLPATVDYILERTAFPSLTVIGYSQGTTSTFVGLASTHDLDDRINLFIGLAPAAFMSQQSSKMLAAFGEADIQAMIKGFHIRDATPACWIMELIGMRLCEGKRGQDCAHYLEYFVGKDDIDPSHNKNVSRMELYNDHYPSGTSIVNLMHWLQLVASANFSAYDYGGDVPNRAHYGQPTPPVYDLSAINVPMAFFTGGKDALADPVDVAKTMLQLRAHLIIAQYDIPWYDHIDFIIGEDSPQVLFPPLIKLLNLYKHSPDIRVATA